MHQCELCVCMIEDCDSNYDQGMIVLKAGGSYSQRNIKNTAAAKFGRSFVVDSLKSQKDGELNLSVLRVTYLIQASASNALLSTFSAGLGIRHLGNHSNNLVQLPD